MHPLSTLPVCAGTLQEFLWQGPSTDVTQLEVLALPCNSSMMPTPLCFGPAPSSLPLASTVIALPFQHRQPQDSEQVLHQPHSIVECRKPAASTGMSMPLCVQIHQGFSTLKAQKRTRCSHNKLK